MLKNLDITTSIQEISNESAPYLNTSHYSNNNTNIKINSQIQDGDFNIENILSLIYNIKNENDFYKLKESVVVSGSPEFIYRFAQGILDIFFEEQSFNTTLSSNSKLTISQKNIIYDETLNLLLEQSQKNHALSQFLLGKIYYTRKIYYKSFRFFELALKNRFYDAAFYLGLFFEHGLGIDSNVEKAEYFYLRAIESTLGHIAMLQLAHLYLNQKINGKSRIKEAIFWLERAAMLDSDLIDVEKINNLKNNNTNTINPLPLYESSGINKEESDNMLMTPFRVQSLPFIKDKVKTSFSNNTTPLLTAQFNKERRRSLATAKINKKYTHNHSYSYSYGTSTTSFNSINNNTKHNSSNSQSSNEYQELKIQFNSKDNTEENTELLIKNNTEDIDCITELESEINKDSEQDIDSKSQRSIDSQHSNSVIMSPSIIEDVSKLVKDEEESFEISSVKSNYFEKMKDKLKISKNVQFNLQVQAEACFILYELYRNSYQNLIEKNLKLSKYYLNIASLNGSTKAMYYRGLYFSNSFEKTKEWITKAAEQNHLYSQILLIYWNLGGLNEQDIDEASALFWLQCASRLDNLSTEEEKMVQAKIWYVLASFYEEGISDILKPDDQESKLLYRLASLRNLPEAIIKMEKFENEEEDNFESYDYYVYLNQKKKHRKDHKKNLSEKRLSRRQSKFEKRHSKGVASDDISINTYRLSNGNNSDIGSLSSDTAIKNPSNLIRRGSILTNNIDRRNSVSTYNTNISEYRRGSISTLTSNEYRRSSISNGNMIGSRVGSITSNYTDTEGSSYDNYSTVRTIEALKTNDADQNNTYNEIMERRNTLTKKNSILRKGSFLNITSLFDKHDHSNKSDTESISTNTIKGPNIDHMINKYYSKNNYIVTSILLLLNIPHALVLPYPSQIPTPTSSFQNSNPLISHTPYLRSKSVMSSSSKINQIPSTYNFNNLLRKGSISNSSLNNYSHNHIHTKIRNSIQPKIPSSNLISTLKRNKKTNHPIGNIIYNNDDNELDSNSSSLSVDESDNEFNDSSDDTKKISNTQNTTKRHPPKFLISSTSTDDKNINENESINKNINNSNYTNTIVCNSPSMMTSKDLIYQNKKYSNSDSKLNTIEVSEKQNLEIIHPLTKSKTVIGHKKNNSLNSLNINNFTPLKSNSMALSDIDSGSSYTRNSELSSLPGNSVYSHYPKSSYSSTNSLNQLEDLKDKYIEKDKIKKKLNKNVEASVIMNKRSSSLSKYQQMKYNLNLQNINNNNNNNSRANENTKSKNDTSLNKPETNNNMHNIYEKKVLNNYSFNSTTNILDTPFMNSSPSLSEQISEKFNQIMDKEDGELSDKGEIIEINDNNREISENIINENDISTNDYSYDLESSNDYNYNDYTVFEKRTSTLLYNDYINSFNYASNSLINPSYDNPQSNLKINSKDDNINSTTKSKSKSKNKGKKRSLLKMRSIINSFSSERERNNSLKKKEELQNNTSFNLNNENNDSGIKLYLKRYHKNDNQSNSNNNLYRTSTIESNTNTTDSMDDTYSEITKNKGFMKKSRELLKNKISKSKLLLHHKSSNGSSKSKHRNSKDNKSFLGKDVSIIEDPLYENEHNYIEENNLTYLSRVSSGSKSSHIYRHAQSLYDPNQDQLKIVRKLSDLENFKKTYSLINKNYTGIEDHKGETGNVNNHTLLENDYFKAYSSSRPEELYTEKGKSKNINQNNEK